MPQLRKFSLLLLLLFPLQALGATPTIVQKVKFGGASNATTLRNWPFPNAVLSGNTIIVVLQCNNAQTPTVSDDQSGTYTIIQNTDDTGNSQRALLAYRLNVTDGPSVIKVTFTGGGNSYLTGAIFEFYNIASASATDGSNGGTGTGTTRAPGSMTTTTDGDLIITYIAEDSVDPFGTNQAITNWIKPTNFTLAAADRWAGDAVAYYVQPSAGAINPSWTLSPSRTCITLQVAFKNATQGTAPTATPRVVSVIHQGLDYQGNHASPFAIQLPFTDTGNTYYIAYIGLRTPGAITDSNSNTWTATSAVVVNADSGSVRGYYVVAGAMTDGMTTSVAYTGLGASPGETLMAYEMTGIASYDTNANGTLSGSGTSFQIGSITPTTADGLVFSTAGQADNTTLSVNVGTFIASTDPNEEVSPWANDENNAWSVYNNPSTSAVQPTYTQDAAAGNVAWISDSFNPSGAAAASGPFTRSLMGVGK